MRITLWTLPLATAILLSTLPAEGHHSFSATYNVDKQVTAERHTRSNCISLASLLLFRRGQGCQWNRATLDDRRRSRRTVCAPGRG